MQAVRMDMVVIGAAGLLALVLLSKKGAAAALGTAAIDAVDGVLSGGVIAIGERIGIPATDQTKFQQDIAAGDWWNASFDGTASEFIGAAWDRLTGNGSHGATGSW
jgi:hypothetical protein